MTVSRMIQLNSLVPISQTESATQHSLLSTQHSEFTRRDVLSMAAGLGISIHQVGDCLSQLGRHEQAQPWYERAVTEAEQGDIHGRIDHQSLEISRNALRALAPKPTAEDS